MIAPRSPLHPVYLLLWMLLALPGYFVADRYANTPGEPATAPARWPEALPRAAGLHTIVMLAHPRCPCTRASVRELQRLLTRVQGHAEAWVYFTVPAGADAGWVAGDLWESARETPGVHALVDPDGRAAALLGARTSGQVLVYDPAGDLVFSGGITPSRGHEGDSAGFEDIKQVILQERPISALVALVFGCGLTDDGWEPRP